MRNVRIYINGYLEGTTDIEMKRIVTIAGGQIMYGSSRHFQFVLHSAHMRMVIQAYGLRSDPYSDVAAAEWSEDTQVPDDEVEGDGACGSTRMGHG